MKQKFVIAAIALFAHGSAYAINARYRQQLERSGCTQVSETQGCDISKPKEENTKPGFVSVDTADKAKTTNRTPYAGRWLAKATTGVTVASIRIDRNEHVWVNGKRVKAKRSDGALVFRDGMVTYVIQGDRRLKQEDVWTDFHVGTKGPIVGER